MDRIVDHGDVVAVNWLIENSIKDWKNQIEEATRFINKATERTDFNKVDRAKATAEKFKKVLELTETVATNDTNLVSQTNHLIEISFEIQLEQRSRLRVGNNIRPILFVSDSLEKNFKKEIEKMKFKNCI